MNALAEWFSRLARGGRAARLLRAFGIDPKRYWLLMDLFAELSDRREMLGQLGRDSVGLKTLAWLYFGLSAFLAVIMAAAGPAPRTYLTGFIGMTTFLLAMVLLSEITTSLLNPVEGMVMAHQPVDGATYTAAKLSHLLRIILYLVPGLNAVAAFAGLTLRGSDWRYPLVHMTAAFGTGLLTALAGCALFGWMIRVLPPARLKAAGQVAEILPLPLFWSSQFFRPALARFYAKLTLPGGEGAGLWVGLAAAGAAAAIVIFGLRALSGDYLAKVAGIMAGPSGSKSKPRRSRTGALVARWFGGPAGRAGFEFVGRMIWRDWQARRQLFLILPTVFLFGALAVRGFNVSPFSGRFTSMHLLPHLFGTALFMLCSLLQYGSDYRGVWVFQSSPDRSIGPFARGVYAWLWIEIIVIPHLVLLFTTAWAWGVRDSALFTAYSAACASGWLGAELRLIGGLPFCRQPEAAPFAFMLPILIAGALVMGVAVAVQYFFVFRSPALVAACTIVMAALAYFITRQSLEAFEGTIRYSLGELSGEATAFYKEVDA